MSRPEVVTVHPRTGVAAADPTGPCCGKCCPMRPGPPTCRCSARRSARTWNAPWPGSPTARRWSTWPPAGGGPTREFDAEVNRLRPGPARPRASPRGTGSGSGRRTAREWVLTQYATAKIGAILVNVNPAYRTHELEYVVKQSGMCTADQRGLLQDQRLPGDDRRDRVRRRGRTSARPDWDDLIAADGDMSEMLRERAATLAFDDPINIQYTSGTTGFPKGATLSHHNILNNGYFVGELVNYTEHDRVCLPVPLYHCFGMVMGNLAPPRTAPAWCCRRPGFDPAATLRAVAAEQVHLAVRRADHVHRRAGPAGVRRVTTCPACAPGSWPARPARSR